VRKFPQAEHDDDLSRLQELGKYWCWSADSKFLARIVNKVNPDRNDASKASGRMPALEFVEIYAEEAGFLGIENRPVAGARGLAWSPKRPLPPGAAGDAAGTPRNAPPVLGWWVPQVDEHDYTFEQLAFLKYEKEGDTAFERLAAEPPPKPVNGVEQQISLKKKMAEYVIALKNGKSPTGAQPARASAQPRVRANYYNPPRAAEKEVPHPDEAPKVRKDAKKVKNEHTDEFDRMVRWAQLEPTRVEKLPPPALSTASFLRVVRRRRHSSGGPRQTTPSFRLTGHAAPPPSPALTSVALRGRDFHQGDVQAGAPKSRAGRVTHLVAAGGLRRRRR
jgi:hypothetical protein